RVGYASAAEHGSAEARLHGWHLQLVAHRPAGPIPPLEVIGIHRLRRAVEGVNLLVELRPGKGGEMQEGPFADPLVRVRRAGAQQHTGSVYAAAGQDVMPGVYLDAP